MKYIFVAALFVLIGCNSREPVKTGLEGKPLPLFKFLMQDGVTYFDTKNIQTGNPSVLLYYNPRCLYCRSQLEDILQNMNYLNNIQFYLISDYPLSEIKEFYNKYQLSKYPNIICGIDQSNFINNYFEVPGVPYTAIYGNDKKLIKVFIGKVHSKQIKKTIPS